MTHKSVSGGVQQSREVISPIHIFKPGLIQGVLRTNLVVCIGSVTRKLNGVQTARRPIFPAYSVEMTQLLASRLTHFASLHRDQLAGHVANLDFWSNEVAHCLGVLGTYNARFERLLAAQTQTSPLEPTDFPDFWDSWRAKSQKSRRPRRVPSRQREQVRQELREAFYCFIMRCAATKLIDEATARSVCERHRISIDPLDLHEP